MQLDGDGFARQRAPDEDHPAAVVLLRRNAFVARDRIPAGHLVQELYGHPGLRRLLAACFELDEVHPTSQSRRISAELPGDPQINVVEGAANFGLLPIYPDALRFAAGAP